MHCAKQMFGKLVSLNETFIIEQQKANKLTEHMKYNTKHPIHKYEMHEQLQSTVHNSLWL